MDIQEVICEESSKEDVCQYYEAELLLENESMPNSTHEVIFISSNDEDFDHESEEELDSGENVFLSLNNNDVTNLRSEAKADDDLSSVTESECGICTEMCVQEKMFVPIFCDHKVCRPCAERYYESQIRNRGILDVTCPFPFCTDLFHLDAATKQEYFALTTAQLKEFLSTEVMDLFEKKLRDWSILSMTDFVWCPKCENGQIVDDLVSQNYLTCSQCGCNICTECNKEWTQAHIGLTCAQYEKWQEANDPLEQDKKLDKYLVKHGIECPNCGMRFIKPSGGCLHLKCPMSQCRHEFCEGCLQPYIYGNKCSEPKCIGMGFHAHHPRNCFFFLRDWEPARLQNLLRRSSIYFETETLIPGNRCQIIEQKETLSGLVDEACGDMVEPYHAGYCRKHYIRYLGQLILDHGVDPVMEYDVAELEHYLKKMSIPLHLKVHDRTTLIKIVQDLGEMNVCCTTLAAKERGFDINRRIDVESDDEQYQDAAGACASAPAAATMSLWKCAFCTYDNPFGKPICEMCCRTQTTVIDDFEMFEDGVECIRCTLINLPGCPVCEACGAALTLNSPLLA